MNNILSNYKKIIVVGFSMIWPFLFLLCPENVFSDNDMAVPRKVVVGTSEAPPLCMKTADFQWEGLSIEIWQNTAQRMNVLFEFREYRSIELLMDALISGEIDVIPFMAVSDSYESILEFSQSYLKSGLAIAVPAEGTDNRLMNVIAKIFSKDILSAVGLLMLMCLVAGIFVWLFERHRNNEMFGDGTVKGIGHGVWWSIVTMTTVGYGDKAPKTIGGRTVALIWMLFSIVFIASFTASITTSLTLSELRGKVHGFNDLYNARVGSLPKSAASNFLTKHGITVIPFESLQEGMEAVTSNKIDAFVLNEIILKYLVKTEFPGRIQVIPGTFDEYFVSIALQEKSSLRKPINKALLKFMNTEKWSELLNRYIH